MKCIEDSGLLNYAIKQVCQPGKKQYSDKGLSA